MPQDNATRPRPKWLRVNVTDEWLKFEPQIPRPDEGPEPLWVPLDHDRELVRLAEELEAAADRLRGMAEEREDTRADRLMGQRAEAPAVATPTTGDCIPEVIAR